MQSPYPSKNTSKTYPTNHMNDLNKSQTQNRP